MCGVQYIQMRGAWKSEMGRKEAESLASLVYKVVSYRACAEAKEWRAGIYA